METFLPSEVSRDPVSVMSSQQFIGTVTVSRFSWAFKFSSKILKSTTIWWAAPFLVLISLKEMALSLSSTMALYSPSGQGVTEVDIGPSAVWLRKASALKDILVVLMLPGRWKVYPRWQEPRPSAIVRRAACRRRQLVGRRER